MNRINTFITDNEYESLTPDVRYYIVFPIFIFLTVGIVFLPSIQIQLFSVCHSYQYTYFISLFIILFFALIFNFYYFDYVVQNFCILEN